MKIKVFFFVLSCFFSVLFSFAYADDLSYENKQTEKFFDKRIRRYVDVAKGELLVKYKDLISIQSINTFNSQNNLKIVRTLSNKKIKLLKIADESKNSSLKDIVDAYNKNPLIEYAEPNFALYKLSVTPNDPYYYEQWGLPLIHANDGWDITKGNSDVIIAVVDSGIDFTHEDLQDKVWINPIEGSAGNKNNGIDDDGNGYIDDWEGWDFFASDNDPSDLDGHGTHVSGIAAAVTNNGKGVAGVSWNSKIMVVRVLNFRGMGFVDITADGVRYAADNGAKVINMSLGSYSFVDSMNEAVQYAYNKGCVLVAAAGNDGDPTVEYPASYENVIGVGSIGPDNNRSSFSTYNESVDVCAPGGDGGSSNSGNILSTYKGNAYAYSYGTSMSTPFVSGLASLIFAQNSTWANSQVINKIVSSADDLGTAGWDPYYGSGKINVYAALSFGSSSTQESTTKTIYAYPNPARETGDQMLRFYF